VGRTALRPRTGRRGTVSVGGRLSFGGSDPKPRLSAGRTVTDRPSERRTARGRRPGPWPRVDLAL